MTRHNTTTAIPYTLGSLLDDILRDELEAEAEEDFDTLRQRLSGLGPEVLDGLLEAARADRYRPLHPVLLKVLLDASYPPAMPHLIRAMLEHDDPFVRFDLAQGFDRLAGYPFEVAEMHEDGWIHHDEVERAADKLHTWWQEEGHHEHPTLTQWREDRLEDNHAEQRTPRTEVFGFVFQQPGWVVLDDGRVLQPRGPLPRQAGVYVVAGSARWGDRDAPGRVVLELDSSDAAETVVWAWERQGWRDVTREATGVTPAIPLGMGGEGCDLETPFRLGKEPRVEQPPPRLNQVLGIIRGLLTQPQPTIEAVSELARWSVETPDPTVLAYIQEGIARWPGALQRSYTRQRQRLASAQRAHTALAALRRDIAWLLTEGAKQHPGDNLWLAEALGPVYERANTALGSHEINRAVQVQVPPWAPRSVWIVGARGFEASNREDTVILEWNHGDWRGGSFSYYDGAHPGDFRLEEDWWFEARRDALAPLLVDAFPGFDPRTYGLPEEP